MKFLKRICAPFILPVLMIGILATSCSKDDDKPSYSCESCVSTPDALAVNDASIKGVYKGIVIGSTGTISINIQNGNSTISATLVLDDISVALTSNVAIVDGQPYLAPFTGTYNGSSVSLTFSVGFGGSNPTLVSSSIPGHPNAVFVIAKETSTSLIEAFEGTYSISDGETGVFNLVLSSGIGAFSYIARENGQAETNSGSGTVNSSGQLIQDGVVLGTISGDVINGTFVNADDLSVTITGNRTL
jgi:hypothetical protein